MAQTMHVGDIEMDFCCFGTGSRALVVLPGLSLKSVTASGDVLKLLFADFLLDFTVYLFDGRANVYEGYSVEDMARDTVCVMRALGISNACIYGASLGGMVAQVIALEYPDLVDRLVLASTCARGNESLREAMRRWIAFSKAGDTRALLDSFACLVYSESRRKAYSEIFASITATAEELRHFRIFAEAIAKYDIYDRECGTRVKALVVGSEGDLVMTGQASRELAASLGGTLVMYGTEYGHAVYDEAPDFFARMKTFFTET